jgi:hypothetical protein
MKIDNPKDRVNLIWWTTKTVFSTTILVILYLINVVLSCTGKILLFFSTLFFIPVYILLALIISLVLVCLSIGLMPLEIIAFLISGNTAIFSIPYKIISRIWDEDEYPIRLRDGMFELLDRSWIFINLD